jgi:hypothetical protein
VQRKRGRPHATLYLVHLEAFLVRLDRALSERPATHPARVCFELARVVGAKVEFAGPEGQTLGFEEFEAWWQRGGPDPFLDGEGRATLRVQSSPRISDWAVLNARLGPGGLVVERRHTMLRSWVTDD